MPDAAWEQIPTENYQNLWGPFDARFNFRPNTWQHPGIIEPTPSATIDLAPIFASKAAESAAAAGAVNALALLAMTRVFSPLGGCSSSTGSTRAGGASSTRTGTSRPCPVPGTCSIAAVHSSLV